MQEIGFVKYGQLGGVMISRVGKLCPIMAWEMRDAMSTNGKSWAYFAKVVESIREENAKPKPPPGQNRKQTRSTFRDVTEEAMKIAIEEDAKNETG